MALQTTQNFDRGGLAATYNAVASTDTFVPGSTTFLHVKNASGSSINVSITVPAGREPIPGLSLKTPYTVVAVAAGAEKFIGPLPASFFADPTTGLGTVAYSATATVTAAVVNMLQP